MTFFLLLTCYKGRERGCSKGTAVQGAQQRHKQGSSPVRVTGDGGDSCLEVMGMHRKVHLPRGPGEVESPDKWCFGVCLLGVWGASLH